MALGESRWHWVERVRLALTYLPFGIFSSFKKVFMGYFNAVKAVITNKKLLMT
jgi:hypothetical protein